MYNHKIALVMGSENQDKGNLYVGGYESLESISENRIGAVLSAVWVGKFKANENL